MHHHPQARHARFRREGNDLHYDLHISLKESLLGFNKKIEHLDGHQVTVKQPKITQPFEVGRVCAVYVCMCVLYSKAAHTDCALWFIMSYPIPPHV